MFKFIIGLAQAWRDALNRACVATNHRVLLRQYGQMLGPDNWRYEIGYPADFYEAYFGFMEWLENRMWLDRLAWWVVRFQHRKLRVRIGHVLQEVYMEKFIAIAMMHRHLR